MAGAGAAVRVQVLGPVRAWRGDQEMDLGAPQQRAVLAVLALASGKIVSRHELIDAVWDAPTGKVDSTLYANVSRLRGVLEPGRGQRAASQVLITSGPGYLLRVEVDAAAFSGEVAAARQARAAGNLAAAADGLRAALGRWHGTALAGLGGLWVAGERVRLEEARLTALEEHAQVQLALGRHGEMAAELAGLAGKHPLREELRVLLMLALYRSGRQAEALAVFHDTRRVLDAELGIEPGPALRRMHERILAADPALNLPAATGPPRAPDHAGPAPAPPPPVPAALPVPRELPADVDGFTGREAELAELDWLLPTAAGQEPDPGGRAPGAPGPVVISVLSGTAGVGKTALAVHWAHRVAAEFPDGQLYVNLRGYDPDQPVEPGEALAAFLRALGVTGADVPLGEAERAARYRSLATGKRLLVVLDNAATVEQVRPLLPGSPTVMVLVTSRDALAGLVARDGARRLDLDLLPAGEAAALLHTLIGGRADTDPAAARALAGYCARLPLALRVAAEMAAAHPDAPLAQLSAELASQEERLDLLDAGGDPRSAVASVFSWSYRDLAADTARMFRLLGLHPAQDWDRYAAAALTGAVSVAQAGRHLRVLAQAHLIQPAAAGRYQMHDLLRAYAAGLAAGQDGDEERRAALTRLFDYYLAAGAAAMDVLIPAERSRRPQPPAVSTPVPVLEDLTAARGWLDAEMPTLTAVAISAAGHGWPSHATRLVDALFRYLYSGRISEGLTISTHALQAARGSADRSAEASMLTRLGAFHGAQDRYQQAAECHQQSLVLARELGDRRAEAMATVGLATTHQWQGRPQQAIEGYQQALALFREIDEQVGQIRLLSNLGSVYVWLREYPQAAAHLHEAVALARTIDARFNMVQGLALLGQVCRGQGQYAQAVEHLRECLALCEQTGERHYEGRALTRLGDVCARMGHYGEALGYQRQALAVCQAGGDPGGEAEALNGSGEALLGLGQPAQAAVSYDTALSMARQTSDRYEQARALAGLAEVHHEQGHYPQAADCHEQALALYRELADPAGQARVLISTAGTLLATGEPARARSCLDTALALSERIGDPYEQARAHRGLAAVCQATADPSGTSRHESRARALYAALGVPIRVGLG
jgi:DNA-binding SARP family transcriptional activator/tetratricopeptide (TPR) repeat protein